jgi:hypothetical protein
MKSRMIYFVALDDTDNKDSRGTGFKSRELGKLIHEKKLGNVESISRHQLFVHEKIAYTSQNSSACLIIKSDKYEELRDLCENYLIDVAEIGSDAGLCIAREDQINEIILDWGIRAKKEILFKEDAYNIAQDAGIFLRGYTGEKIGVIGSLAAIGLRKAGNDGRNIWLKGYELRDLKGAYQIKELKRIINIQAVLTKAGEPVNEEDYMDVGEWLRPPIVNGLNTAIVEQNKNGEDYEWKCVSKDYIKSISD